MQLNQLKSDNKKTKKRIGRGIGSGTGKTSGKGHKGQKARSGVAIKGFEGGQMPIHRRLPKRGFKNIFRREYVPINLGIIQKLINEKKIAPETPLDLETLLKVGLLKKNNNNIKILAKGDFKSKIKFVGFNFSKNAKIIVEKNGGTFENLNNNITFIEWPEMLISLPLNKNHYLINLDMISETKRKINICFKQ